MGEVRVSLALLLRVPGIADDVRGIDRFTSPATIQAKSMRSAASRCLTVGRELVCGWRSTKAVTCAGPELGEEGRELAHRLEVGAAGIAVADGSERPREETAKIIPFETAETQANMVDTGPKG